MRFLKFLTLAILSLMAFSLMAGVNLKNGNFYISYTDIVVPGGGPSLEITRTYNSKSTVDGWFGFGWGSDYETFLQVSGDSSVTIFENGSGAHTRFSPKGEVNVQEAAQNIVDAMRKKDEMTDSAAKDLVKKLVGDAELRHAYAARFDVKSNIADGSVLYSNARGIQELHKLKDGFKRVFSDNREEYFNLAGKLTKIVDKNGYEVILNYNKNGVLESIKDSMAKQLFFSWFPDGKVKNIWSSDDKKAVYKYKDKDLIESTDVSGNTYAFHYDENHNLNKVGYSDGSEMAIVYEPKTQFVSSVTNKDKETIKYTYGGDAKNPDLHYWTEVTQNDLAGKPVTNRYEYEIRTRPDGTEYNYRILTIVNGLKTETIYTECCSLPLKIARGDEVTNFEYNGKGLLVKKTSTSGEFVNIEYHPELNKITKVVNKDGWTQYKYDKAGNLLKANNNAGQTVALIYDRKGRITKMVDQKGNEADQRILSFKYNALGKPVEIEMEKVGKINVAYDNYGEIKKVESKTGHKMAMQVTEAFQNLLEIVKPAGVDLSL
ncbi:MAG: DUF6531 domain-containing protein [Bacteriovoracaceae bacterium]